MINHIVFDLGGVLIDWNPQYLYRSLLPDAVQREHFLTHIATPDWNEAQDEGRSLAEGTAWLVDQHPEYEMLIRAYYGRWPEMLGGPIDGTVALLRQLHQQQAYPLYALTNWSAETWPIAVTRFDFLEWFDGILVSGQEGKRKPNPAFYQLLTDRFGVDLRQGVFIDDNVRNVRAARALGMTALPFSSPAVLAHQLHKLGLL